MHKKLQDFLKSSDSYNVQHILKKTLDSKFYYECSILYGKLGEHQKALSILVKEMKNYDLAEQYCIEISSKETSSEFRYYIYHMLLELYLELGKE